MSVQSFAQVNNNVYYRKKPENNVIFYDFEKSVGNYHVTRDALHARSGNAALRIDAHKVNTSLMRTTSCAGDPVEAEAYIQALQMILN